MSGVSAGAGHLEVGGVDADGARYEAEDGEGSNISAEAQLFFTAVANQDVGQAKEILARYPNVEVDFMGDCSTYTGGEVHGICSALNLAAHVGNVPLVNLLIEAGSNVNSKDLEDGNTSLLSASYAGCVEAIAALVSAGACLEDVDSEGFTPLVLAICGEHEAAAQLLIQLGADVNATDADDFSALMYAALVNQIAVVKSLLKAACMIEAPSTPGAPPCARDLAVREGHDEVVKAIDDEVYWRKRQPAYRLRACLVSLRRQRIEELYLKDAQQQRCQTQYGSGSENGTSEGSDSECQQVVRRGEGEIRGPEQPQGGAQVVEAAVHSEDGDDEEKKEQVEHWAENEKKERAEKRQRKECCNRAEEEAGEDASLLLN